MTAQDASLLWRPILSDLRVLLVEDDLDSGEVFALLLEAKGASVTWASSVRDALRVLDVERFDVLVSDIGMPDEDGCALIGRVRARGGAVPAVALTAFGGDADRERALEAGFDAFATKPILCDELSVVVAAVARRYEEVRSLRAELRHRAGTERALLAELDRLLGETHELHAPTRGHRGDARRLRGRGAPH